MFLFWVRITFNNAKFQNAHVFLSSQILAMKWMYRTLCADIIGRRSDILKNESDWIFGFSNDPLKIMSII